MADKIEKKIEETKKPASIYQKKTTSIDRIKKIEAAYRPRGYDRNISIGKQPEYKSGINYSKDSKNISSIDFKKKSIDNKTDNLIKNRVDQKQIGSKEDRARRAVERAMKNKTSREKAEKAENEKGFIQKFKEYNKILNIDSLARRYLVMNSFDGVLTILGILMGGFFSGLIESKIILVACLGAGVAMGVSGVWGAYLTETAERKKELRELESSMLTRLKHTKIGKASRFAPWIVALIDGAAPFITSIFVISPFFFVHTILAYYISFVLIFVLLFILGIFLGRISKENLIMSACKMLLAGITCATILYLVGLPPV